MLLDSFGHPVEHRPTLFCKTMLDDVLWCFTRLDGALVVDFLVGFSLDRFRRVWVSTWRPSAPLFLVSTSCPMMSCWRFCHKPRIQQQCSLTWGNALRTLQRYVFRWCTFERKIDKIKGPLGYVERGKKRAKAFCAQSSLVKFTAVNADRPTLKTLTSCYAVICESNQRTLGRLTDLLNEVKEGVQCMLVKFFVRKAAWLKFTAVNADCHTPKIPRSCYAVICE